MFPLSAITGNAALDVLVGLFFLYFLLSIVCSAVNEGIASALNLRAKNLEEAIFSLLGDEAHAKAFYEHHRITALFKPGKADGKPTVGGRKPSYIPSRAFAMTLLDMFIPATPPAGDAPTPHLVEAVKAELAKVDAIKNDRVRGLLQDAIHEAGGDANRFRAAIERSYDEVMDRASGWYKRKVQVILLAIAFALVVVINADSFGIGQRLWKDDALRAAVVAQANTAVQSGKATCVTSGASAPDNAATCVDEVKALGIPLGWSHANSPQSVTSGIGKAIGLLVTIFALSLGAPFWFDLLGKVANLRGSGPPAAGAQTQPTTTTTTTTT